MTRTTVEQQREVALTRANEIRKGRAALKRQIRAGDGTVAAVLFDPPDVAANWPVYELLLLHPRFGKTKARKLLGSERIPELKPVGSLTERQRDRIIGRLG